MSKAEILIRIGIPIFLTTKRWSPWLETKETYFWQSHCTEMLNIAVIAVVLCACISFAAAWRPVWGGHASFHPVAGMRSYLSRPTRCLGLNEAHQNAICEALQTDSKDAVVAKLARLARYPVKNNTVDGLLFLLHMVRKLRKAPPTQKFLMAILNHSIANHKLLPNVLSVNRARDATTGLFKSNLTVVGDTHGQYKDFVMIFENDQIGGFPSESNQFIFNGDLVDRGEQGVEIVTVLLLAKLLYPEAVHILRGNHETRAMTEGYGFQDELREKYDANYRNWDYDYDDTNSIPIIDKFMEFFDSLPIAAVVENTAFVLHGGLGGNCGNMTVSDINRVPRFEEPDGALDDFLWSDPQEELGVCRGTRPPFGPDITQTFLSRNGLQLLIRSHQVRMGGYDVMHDGRTLTVFSAPKYCGVMKNKAAVVRFDQADSDEPAMVQYSECGAKQPHYERHDCKQAGIKWQGLRMSSDM